MDSVALLISMAEAAPETDVEGAVWDLSEQFGLYYLNRSLPRQGVAFHPWRNVRRLGLTLQWGSLRPALGMDVHLSAAASLSSMRMS